MDAANFPLPADLFCVSPEPSSLVSSMATVRSTVEGQQEELVKLGSAMGEVIHRLNHISWNPTPSPAPVTIPAQSSLPTRAVKLPEPYDGEPDGCEGFLL